MSNLNLQEIGLALITKAAGNQGNGNFFNNQNQGTGLFKGGSSNFFSNANTGGGNFGGNFRPGICFQFQNTGRCPRGDACRFRHEAQAQGRVEIGRFAEEENEVMQSSGLSNEDISKLPTMPEVRKFISDKENYALICVDSAVYSEFSDISKLLSPGAKKNGKPMRKTWVGAPLREFKDKLVSEGFEPVDDDMDFLDLSARERDLVNQIKDLKTQVKAGGSSSAASASQKKNARSKKSAKSNSKASPKKKAKERVFVMFDSPQDDDGDDLEMQPPVHTKLEELRADFDSKNINFVPRGNGEKFAFDVDNPLQSGHFSAIQGKTPIVPGRGMDLIEVDSLERFTHSLSPLTLTGAMCYVNQFLDLLSYSSCPGEHIRAILATWGWTPSSSMSDGRSLILITILLSDGRDGFGEIDSDLDIDMPEN